MSSESLTNLEYWTKVAQHDRAREVECSARLRRFADLRAGRIADLCNQRASEIDLEVERLDALLKQYAERDRLSRACSALLEAARRVSLGEDIESDLPQYDSSASDLAFYEKAVGRFGYTLAEFRRAAIERTSAKHIDQLFARVFNIWIDEVQQ